MKKTLLTITLLASFVASVFAMSPAFLNSVTGSFCDCSDTFTGNNGDAPDTYKWTESDVATLLDIQGNKLNFSTDTDALHTADIISRGRFEGNFDIQFDFDVTVFEQPDAGNSFCPQVQIRNGDGSVYAHIVRNYISTGANRYFAQGSTTGWDGSDPAAEDAAKIRFVRSGDTLTGYVWDPDDGGGARWEWDDNPAGKTFGETFDMDVYVRVFFSHPNTTAVSEVTGNVDNFVINSGECTY